MRRLLIATMTAGLLTLGTAASTLAVPLLHQHYLTTPSGNVVAIARGICKNQIQAAIDNLHPNVHLGAPGAAFASNPIALTTGACP